VVVGVRFSAAVVLPISTETTYLTRFLPPGRAHPEREGVCYRAGMSWILPTPLLLFAGIVALLPLLGVVRQPTSAPRLVVNAFGATPAVIGLGWLGWITLWPNEQSR
jgi:hypothetical protein